MKRILNKIIKATAAYAAAASLALAGVPAAARGMAEQTVFIYMIASDMADYARDDIAEICGSGLDAAGANVILITDLPDSPGIFRIEGGGMTKLEDISDRNMFDTDDIYDIMFRYMNRCRAKKYSALFWDHGGGFEAGFGYDDTGENDAISVADLAEVFSDIRADVKRDYGREYNYETIGFDACLMSDIQTQQAFSDAGFKYFIGSEDVESAYGWDYSFLSKLNSSPDIGGAELGRVVADTAADCLARLGAQKQCGIAVTDLSKTDALISQINSTLSAADTSALWSARTNTAGFGTDGEYADIYELAERLTERGIDGSGIAAAADDAVIYKRGGGISLYFPTADTNLSVDAKNLDGYKTALARMAEVYEPSAAAVVSGAQPASSGNTYSYTLTDYDKKIFSGARFAVYKEENGIYRPVYTDDAVTRSGDTLVFEYDNTALTLDGAYPVALEIRGGRRYAVLYRDCGSVGGFGDFRPIEAELDEDGSIINTRYRDNTRLAAKDDSRICAGDRVYDGAVLYNTDNSPAAYIPDIVTIHSPELEFTALCGEYVCRFEIINPYGYIGGYSPMATPGTAETKAESGVCELNGAAADITAGADTIAPPCTVGELEALGYVPISDTAPAGSSYATMRRDGEYIDIIVTNTTQSTADISECTVTAISVTSGSCCGMTVGYTTTGKGADMAYITDRTIRYVYKLNDTSVLPEFSGDAGLNGLYSGTVGGYVAVEAMRSDGTIRRISSVYTAADSGLRYFIY